MISNRSHGMRKYKSTDSHYLELATRSFNFKSLTENVENTKGSSKQLPSSQLLLNALPKPLQVKHNPRPHQTGDSIFYRLPDDIFITKEQLSSSSSSLSSGILQPSFFEAINAFKKVSYTQTDRSKTILHCYLEESQQPRSSECPLAWQQVSQELLGTSLDKLGQTIKEYYSTKHEGIDSNNNEQPQSVSSSISKANLSLIETQLASSIPQVIFRRIPAQNSNSSLILSSIHMNKAFLQLFSINIDEFLVQAALQRSLPDLQLINGYQQLVDQSLHGMCGNLLKEEQYPHNQCEFLNKCNNQAYRCTYSFECQDLAKQSQHLLTLRILSVASTRLASDNIFPSSNSLINKRHTMTYPNMKQHDHAFDDASSRSILSKAFDIQLPDNEDQNKCLDTKRDDRQNQPNSSNYYGENPRKIRFQTSDSSTLSC